jgi:hypothetical protein
MLTTLQEDHLVMLEMIVSNMYRDYADELNFLSPVIAMLPSVVNDTDTMDVL